MKSILFLRSVAVNAIHREQGSVHEIEDRDALILIADGAAEIFTPPAKPAIETAEAKPTKKETAAKR